MVEWRYSHFIDHAREVPVMKFRQNRILRILLIALLFVFALPGIVSHAQSSTPAVYVIAIDGEITPAMAVFLQRSLDEAAASSAEGVIIEISTLGGRVDAAIDMRDAIILSGVPVVVYIRDRAISAGALISIAAKTIIMAPGSHIGAAEPIPNEPKIMAFVSGEFRTTAERNGRDPQIAVAMVDRSVVIPGLVSEGEILDMSANQALAYEYADHLADNREDVMQVMGWQNLVTIEVKPDFRFGIAQFLTSYEIASVLLILGLLALLAEFFTPGFGVAGFVSIVCFALYFASGFLAGYTEWWSVIIFIIGIVFLLIELAAPGFGVFGIAGLLSIFIGIVLAAPTLALGVRTLAIALVALLIAIPVFFKLFGKLRFIQRFVLSTAETIERGYTHAESKIDLLGRTGKTQTVLRPSGIIILDGQRVDAVADGEFIDKHVPVKVIHVEGTRVIVQKTDG